MTIRKGEDWGVVVERPVDLRTAADDADLAGLLADGTGTPTAVASGDLFTTVGARPVEGRTQLLSLPIDLVDVMIDDREPVVAVSHVTVHSPLRAGGWLRGDVLVVMNAEYLGAFDVAPRGHPNDGRIETFRGDTALTLRQRFAVRRRLRNATHLPHPLIATRSVKQAEWTFDRPMAVRVDGRPAGRCRRLGVVVRPDAATLFA